MKIDRKVRFMRHVYQLSADDCWLWVGTRQKSGYGMFHWETTGNRRTMTASRASYILHIGPVPEHMHVCHHCDNPPCVNPSHLFLGSAADNYADMISKKRADYQRGHKRKTHTRVRMLTDDDVRAIRSDTRSVRDIAAAFGCSAINVYNIKARRRKANVPD